jgi:hypothetical protein
MTKTVQARFDGEAFYPEEPMLIAPDTTVLLTVETPEKAEAERSDEEGAVTGMGEPYSFLKLARSLNLEGPEDWSENLDDYLYGDKKLPDE